MCGAVYRNLNETEQIDTNRYRQGPWRRGEHTGARMVREPRAAAAASKTPTASAAVPSLSLHLALT